MLQAVIVIELEPHPTKTTKELSKVPKLNQTKSIVPLMIFNDIRYA